MLYKLFQWNYLINRKYQKQVNIFVLGGKLFWISSVADIQKSESAAAAETLSPFNLCTVYSS